MRAREFITELAYDGNIGIQEMMMFYMQASDEQKALMKKYVAANDTKNAWTLCKQVTGTQLHGKEFTTEGGWASTATQNTTITPQTIVAAVKVMAQFGNEVNQFLQGKGMPPLEIGDPCGSATYYKRDLQQQPDKQYGDIDVNVYIPRLPDTTPNANAAAYKTAIQEFCQASPNYDTDNGVNVIFKLGADDYVQVDLVMAFYENKAWTKALAPEWNVKGVLCNSMYSSLGEALNLSFGGSHGIQVKTMDGVPVKFSTQKGVQLQTITTNPHTWAVDIAAYFGAKRPSSRLEQFPGMMDEPRTADIAQSIIGIAETLEASGTLGQYPDAKTLINNVATIYLGKIDKVINSSKFDKAATPAAIQKAADTKTMLAQKSQQIAKLLRI